MTDVGQVERRQTVPAYLYGAGDFKPLDAEGLLWLADQLCSEQRVHPDRTMSTGWIPSQAAFELPHLVDTFATQSSALAAMQAELDAANGRVEALERAAFENRACAQGNITLGDKRGAAHWRSALQTIVTRIDTHLKDTTP